MASTLIVRHAQASFGSDNYDRLSETGRCQAVRTGEFIRSRWGSLSRIVCGSHERHQATALLIFNALAPHERSGLVIETDARFDEMDVDAQVALYGPGLSRDDAEFAGWLCHSHTDSKSYQKVLRSVFAQWQGAQNAGEIETWPLFSQRVSSAFTASTTATMPGQTSLIVTSSGVIATIIQQILGIEQNGVYALFEVVRNCSLTEVLHSGARQSLSCFNETAHLVGVRDDAASVGLLTYR